MSNISVGPLADGKVYTYRPEHDKWFDGDEEAYMIPYRPASENGSGRTVYFHIESRKWVDEYGMGLPTGDSAEIEGEFRKTYKLNGEIRLSVLGSSSVILSDVEPDDPDEEPERLPLERLGYAFEGDDVKQARRPRRGSFL